MSDETKIEQLTLWRRVLLWTPGDQGRGLRYSLVFTLMLILIWTPSLTYLKFAKPVYTSKWSLILPGTGVNTSVNLENIGQATTSSRSAYGSNSISPKVNYKSIAASQVVLEQAAETMAMDVKSFGKPRIKLVDQTSLIFFEVKGGSAEQAQQKSYALYDALETTLTQLRNDEIQRREQSVKAMLTGGREKLKQTQDSLLAYQAESEMVAVAQFNQLSTALGEKKLQLVGLKVEQSGLQGEHERMVNILRLNAEQAAAALMLQTDLVFQENSLHYAQADAMLARQILKMGVNHPEVVKTRDTWLAAKHKLENRVQKLVGKRDTKTLLRLMLSPDKTRGALLERLIMLDAESQGLKKIIVQLDKQIISMRERLNNDTKSAATLDDLKRDHQIAEAVFSSALARIDTGKSDVYASYPLIQMLTSPSLPKKPTTPNPLYVFMGAGAATSISLFGILILWTRKPWLHKILLSE
ncbi:MAG: hypothetical protein KAI17_23260 [Thiotrichaceae bacterium]|nr:hypothetical protein [Thiotrichaceae bacterium]